MRRFTSIKLTTVRAVLNLLEAIYLRLRKSLVESYSSQV